MLLLNLPAELLLHIIHHIPSVQDKCQLLQTCTHLNNLLCTHVASWSNLDISPFTDITNSILLMFLKNCHIPLYTSTSIYNTILNSITRLDLSGCWCLSQDMAVALSKSFQQLEELCLNGYRTTQRDHLYHVRPSHDLSSMTMDLSKRNTHQLKIPYNLLTTILLQIPRITSLSIQYQDLSSTTTDKNYFPREIFGKIRHLDISSCIITQPALQSMLRKIGNELLTLKMLNIELNQLSWLGVNQHGKNLVTLHVSCNEPLYLPCIRQAVSNLKYLNDFRLTRVRTGTVDPIIEKLNPNTLKRLDISPKMNIYPSSLPINDTASSSSGSRRIPRSSRHVKITSSLHSTTAASLSHSPPRSATTTAATRKHPPQATREMTHQQQFATTEYDLIISDISFHHLCSCHHLTELRLCFPTITSSTQLSQLFQAIPQLEIFELRQQDQQQQQNKQDYLEGLVHLKSLQKLYLYGVSISQDCIEVLATHTQLIRQMTIHQGGEVIEKKENQVYLVNQCRVLNSLNLGQLNQPVTSKENWPSFGYSSDQEEMIRNCIVDSTFNLTFLKKSQYFNNKISWLWCVQ